jgi:hypothetical protein
LPARYYEADSHRAFDKSLKALREVEADAPTRIEAAPDFTIPDVPDSRVGSCSEAIPPPDRDQAPTFPDAPFVEDPVVRGIDGPPRGPTRPIPPSV